MASETLGSVLFLSLLFGLTFTARLVNYRRFGLAARQRSMGDGAFILILMAAAFVLATYGGQRSALLTAALAGIAFNVGRWRGSQEPTPELSTDAREIWSRHA